MRQHNLSLLLHILAEDGPASRAALATRTGLTRAGVSTLTEELIRAGLLVELGRDRPGRVGRPGSALGLAETGLCGLGGEVGVDRIAVCAMDLRGRVRIRHEAASANRASAPGPVLARLREMAEAVAAEAAQCGLRPAGLAVAVPALVRRGTSTVVHAPNLGWQHTDVAAYLGGELPLTVDNEANFGALAHLWRSGEPAPEAQGRPGRAPRTDRSSFTSRASRGQVAGSGDSAAAAGAPDGSSLRDFLHVSAAAGIGAAVIQDGRLVRGRHGFAGELGHVPVYPSGPRCACGGRGCLEQYAGEPALLRAAGLDGRPAEAAPSGEGRGAALVPLARRAQEGHPAARSALRSAGRAFGIALAGAVNLLDPETVVLGGSLAPLSSWLLPPMEAELRRRTAAPGEAPAVVPSPLGTDGPLLGAAHSVVRAALADPLGYVAAANGRA